MLPSRGAIRSLSTARTSLTSQSFSNTSRFLDGHGRRFGTSTRLVGATWNGQAGVRPGALRSMAGAALLAGSVPARRAISFNFWSRPKTETAAAVPEAPVETVKAETLTSESAAPAASTPPIDAAAPPTPPSSLDSLNLNIEPPTGLDWSLPDISSMPEQIGYLKQLGLDFGLGPSSMVQWLLEHVYIYTGLPWWGTIVATTVIIRVLLLQPALKAQTNSAKMQELQTKPDYVALKEQMTTSMSKGDQASMNEARMALSAIHKRNGVNPLASFWGFIQIPFGYGTFVVLNNMAKIPVPSLETGGLLWFTDLTIPDPFYILPLLGPLGMLAMLRSQMQTTPAQARAQIKLMAMFLVPVSALVTLWLPAGIQFYFIVTTALAMAQNSIFRNPTVRSVFGLAPLPPPPPPSSTTHISGALYQSPTPSAGGAAAHNTISARPVEEPKKGGLSGTFAEIKQTIHNAKGGAGNYAEQQQKEKAEKDMKAWEKRRAEEDRQKILAELRKKKSNKNN